MIYTVVHITLVKFLLLFLIESQGYRIVHESKNRLIVSGVFFEDFEDFDFYVNSVKLTGVRKLKTENSTHKVSCDNDRLQCDCKKAEYNYTCRHRQTVAKAVMEIDINSYLSRLITDSSLEQQRKIKLFVIANYNISKDDLIKKGGIINALGRFQKVTLIKFIEGWKYEH